MMEIPCGMQEQFLEAKELIESSNDIKIYTHTDCDGICSGAILSIILDRLNKDYEIDLSFEKNLESFYQKNKVEKSVKQIIQEAMENA